MLALGIILVLLAVAALIAALAGGSNQPASFDLGLVNIQTNTLGVFLLGAATVLLLVIGIALIGAGIRRAGRRRQERKKLDRLTQELHARDSKETQVGGTTPASRPTSAPAETESRATTEEAPEPRGPGKHADGPVTEQDRPTP